MAKQAINVGVTANDKKGDSLRAAFQKVNSNFTELYTALGLADDTTLSLGAFEFSDSVSGVATMSTTDSSSILIDQAVTVTSDLTVSGDVLPTVAQGGDLGSTGQRWNNLYSNKINNLLFDRVEGQTYYVTQDGDDIEPGTSVQGAFATIKKALTVAVAGVTIKVGAGTFTEVFPLTVPAGVSIVGVGIRPTKIVPTVETNNKDAFLLEGESGVVDLTIADFFYDAINDTGYAFRFKNSAVITTRSPYIERVTVLCRGSGPTASDPYGFLTGDAGRGAEVDGAKVTRASLEAAMLFNECTFIVPNSRGLIMKNGARVEWLTCFTYFADLAIEGVVGATGRGGDGKTRITFTNVSGTGWQAGENIQYTSTDGSTVFNILVDSVVSSDTVLVDGKFDTLEGEDFTPGAGGSIVGLNSSTTATGISRYDRSEFAAELRSIASANIYGNQGAKADGDDVKLQLMAHNFAYIGTGADLTNNNTVVIQANEVIEVNGGRVYFNSVDQAGTWRVGELFSVDFETGNVTFQAPSFDVSSLSGINFTNGVQSTIIDPTQVTTGNLTLSGSTLTSSTGNITIDPSGDSDIILNADVNITGNLTASVIANDSTLLVDAVAGIVPAEVVSGALTNCTADGTNAVGYRNIPQSGSAKTASYTLATDDVGKLIEVGVGGSITVPNATFATGDAVLIFNNTSGSITLTMSITTSYIGGVNADDNSISLATRGVATVLFISGTVCVVTGNVS